MRGARVRLPGQAASDVSAFRSKWTRRCWNSVVVCLLASTLPASAESPHAYLTIAYESADVSHVACLLEYPGHKPRWVGFGPEFKYKVLADGAVDTTSIEWQIERYVRFRVDAKRLAQAELRVRRQYGDDLYVLGAHDCVTFAIDLARYAGLDTPSHFHYQVEGLLDDLAERNPKRLTSIDRLPYPWHRCPLLKAGKVKEDDRVVVRLESIECLESESIAMSDRVYLVAVTEDGQRRKFDIGKLNDGDRWTAGAVLFRVRRGTAIGVQLWDADRFNHDDLIFQTSICACKDGSICKTQTRGRAVTASTSIYRVRLKIESDRTAEQRRGETMPARE